MQDAIGHRVGLHIDIRHILFLYRYFHNLALALHAEDLRKRHKALRSTHKQHDNAAAQLRIHHKLHGLSCCIFRLVRNQLQRIVAEIASIVARSMDGEKLRAFHGTPLCVRHRPAQAVLSCAGCAEHLPPMPLRIGINGPTALLRLLCHALFVVCNAVQHQKPLAADRRAVQSPCLHGGRHRITDQAIASIQPDIRLERFACDSHISVPEDFAAACIRHGSRDFVLMVMVAKEFFGHGGINCNLHGTIGFQLFLKVQDHFRRLVAETIAVPTPAWGAAAPSRPAWIPRAVCPKPPIAVPVIPVPQADGPPCRLPS